LKVRQKIAKVVNSAGMTWHFDVFEMMVSIFKRVNLSESIANECEMELVSNTLYSLLKFYQTVAIELYKLLDPFLDPTLLASLLHFVKYCANHKEIQYPAV
jgi:hypothetical protein